jgi:hypothetical protein
MFDEIIHKYLDNNYCINYDFLPKEIALISLSGDITQCYSVRQELSYFFGINEETSKDLIISWILSKFMCVPECGWDKLFKRPPKLKAAWSPELAQDISAFPNTDAEGELVASLAKEVAKEIDSQIFNNLINSVDTMDTFIDTMDNFGYELGPTVYNPMNFQTIRYFILKS